MRAHGIRGEVVVFALTDREERFSAGGGLGLSASPDGAEAVRPVTVESSRSHRGHWLLKLEGIESRTEAERRAGEFLVIPRAAAEEAREEDEFFLYALVGREVRSEGGARIGRVVDVVEPEGAALLEIEVEGGGRRLLPFVKEFVRDVGEPIVVAPPAGWEEL